jgi:peptidoglycan/LPS O-acetylase OafA/YrhL
MVSILSAVGLIHTTRRDILGASSFLTNYRFLFSRDVKGDDFWFVAHFWTLSLEEQFYLLWPITIVLLGFFRARYVALGLIVACPFIRVISYLLWPASAMVDYLPRMLHSGSDLIMVGCLLALLEGNPLMEKAVTARWSAVWALLAALFVLFPSALLAVHFRGYYSFTIGNSFNAVLIAYVLMYIIRHPDSLGTRVLEIGFLRWLGTLSYSLYLWQQMFLRGDEVKPMDHFPLRLVACFAAAVASSYLIERPFLKLRGRMSDRKPVYTSGTSEIGIGDLGVSTRG